MGIGKIMVTAGAAIGLTTATIMGAKVISDKNFQAQQLMQQECKDVYYSSGVDFNQGCKFLDYMNHSEQRQNEAINKLLSKHKFSNPGIYVKANFDIGYLYIHNCNASDTEKLNKVLQIPSGKTFALCVGIDDNIDIAEKFFHTKNDNTISYALDDIENKEAIGEYAKFKETIHEKLSKYFNESKINYDKNQLLFNITPSKKSEIFLKDALMFFPDDMYLKNGPELLRFSKYNSWLHSLFFNAKKPISKTIVIPYEFVIRALCTGIKKVR